MDYLYIGLSIVITAFLISGYYAFKDGHNYYNMD
jgi:hypothetical protein